MKGILLLISLFSLVSCGQNEKSNTSINSDSTILSNKLYTEQIKYKNVNLKAVLLGEKIHLLNSDLTFNKDISSFREQVITITQVSENYQKKSPTDDFCDQFLYVRIKGEGFEGVVDGRNVFELIESAQNASLKNDSCNIKLNATKSFGMSFENDDGLTGCGVYSPVCFTDKTANYIGIVQMVKNKFYEYPYPYFQLIYDDGGKDSIENIEVKNKMYFLTIKRNLQEGEAKMIVKISKNKIGTYDAEILSEERKYE